DPVHKVSIIPRGPALGYTMQLPLEDKYLTSKSEILDKLTILLGGRAAEEILFEEITTGASDDLSRATSYARKMVAQLGMSERLGPIAVHTEEDEVFLGRDISRHKNISEDLARAIDEEVSKLIRDSYQKAKDIIKAHLKEMTTLIDRLLEKEVVDAKEIDEILGLTPPVKEEKEPENKPEVKSEKAEQETKPEPAKKAEKKTVKAKKEDKPKQEPVDDLFGGQDA
nr:cell division protein FtsH [Elusimicrobiaceae bacterium]